MQLVGLPPRDWTHALGTESRVLTNGQTGNSGPWIFLFNLNFLDPTLSRIYLSIYLLLGASEMPPVVKKYACQSRRRKGHGFDPWVSKIPWRRKGQPTPVFLPGKSYGQRTCWATVHRVTKSRTRQGISTSTCMRQVWKATQKFQTVIDCVWGWGDNDCLPDAKWVVRRRGERPHGISFYTFWILKEGNILPILKLNLKIEIYSKIFKHFQSQKEIHY